MAIAAGKLSSNADVQNKGQNKSAEAIRGEIVLDPFKERRIAFSHKLKGKKGEEKTPVAVISVRGVFSRELTPNDDLERVIAEANRVTRLEGFSLIAVRTAFKTWQEEMKNRNERLERISLVQGAEISLANLVRQSVEKFINSKMTKKEIENKIESLVIEKELIELLNERIEKKEKENKTETEK